jgi:membrane fusion protein (multidrug efflux system)
MNASMKTAARRVPRWVWFAGPLLVAGFFTWEWVNSSRRVDTNNAYVKAERIMVSAQVGGRVVEVAVGQDAPVRKGALLFRLDDAPLKIALDQAQARLAMVDNQASATRAQVQGAGSGIVAAAEAERYAQQEVTRAQDLARRQLIPRKTLDDAVHALAEARSQHASAVAAQSQAAAALGGDASIPSKQLPEYRAALAAVEKAQFDLAQAAVYAPVDGVVGNHDLQPGEYLNAGQVAMPLVASDPVWIEANFKETDLAKLRIGQSAGIKVDSYPGVEWTARVASIAPTSGSEFSVLPAQNATGNWVKVVQRIPVRLELVRRGEHPQVLRSGMSAEVKVDVADAPASDHARPAAAVAVH